jgi:hypothetical protein
MPAGKVFITGTARGGTSLLARMLDAHPNMTIALDACLPLYRALRDRAVLARDPDFETAKAFADGYGSAARRAELQALLDVDLDFAVDRVSLEQLQTALGRRAGDESPDLVPALRTLDGGSIEELFEAILALTPRARQVPALRYTGLKDVWTIDAFPALARSFPDARFIAVLRDPRDVVSSMMGFLDKDPAQVGHIPSVLLHWRKMVTCAYHFLADALLRDRFWAVRYEDVVSAPEKFAHDACRFLDLPGDASMVSPAGFRDYGTGKAWQGNSTFDRKLTAISRGPVGRWKRTLPERVVNFVELCCGLEMADCGYDLSREPSELASGDVLSFMIEENQRTCSWRSDSGDPDWDYNFELARRAMFLTPAEPPVEQIETAFLFASYFSHLQAAHSVRADVSLECGR